MSETTPKSTAGPAGPPPRIDGYRYLDKLGEGGYADVYLYENEQLARNVAVKVLRLTDEAALRQFDNEMRVVSRFDDHPHIVPIYNPGRTFDGRPYFTMRYCSNGTLAAKVRSGPLPVAEVVDTGICIGRALATVHAARLLHRDVKPSNILVDGNNRPQLSDFGIAGAQHPSSGAERGDHAVSPAWSPPELLAGEYGSVRSDVYSLGATLWHLLVGHSPYYSPGGQNSAEPDGPLERRIRAGRLPALRRAGVPAELESLLRSMLAKEPDRRPAGAELVVARLEALGRPDPTPAPPDRTRRFADASTAGLPAFPESPMPGWISEDPPQEHTRDRAEPAQTGDRSPAGRRILIGVGVVAVLAAALFGAEALAHNGSSAAAHSPTATRTGLGAVPVDQDPGVLGENEPPGTPTVTATRTGPRTLQFSWTYPASQPTDTFDWRATDGPQSGTAATPSVDVPDPAGTELCLEVRVVRMTGSDASVAWSPAGCGS
jgi:eukaryotic-like serine/threonine-protein kinase